MQTIRRTDTAYRVRVEIDSTLPKRDQMRVAEAFSVVLCGLIIRVPAGFVTDCHSTPPWLHSLLPAYDCRTNLAAIVHDYLYMHWADVFLQNPPSRHTIRYAEKDPGYYRWLADECYRELMEQFRPGHWRNPIYYRAVRLFGGLNWHRFRQNEGREVR